MNQVILLNADMSYMGVVHWQRALKLIFTEKAEIVQTGVKEIFNFDRSFSFVIPSAVRLKKFIGAIFRGQVPFNKRNIKIRDNHECQYCGARGVPLNIDHVIPQSRGGATSWENCVTSCMPCNSKKADKRLEQSGMTLRNIPRKPSVGEFIERRVHQLAGEIDYNVLDWGYIDEKSSKIS
jgi:5-methylcytosine-specific restriction endonuclease McrA